MIPLYGEHMEREVFNVRRAKLQNLFEEAALQLLTLGVPVIFDFGFWTKIERAANLHAVFRRVKLKHAIKHILILPSNKYPRDNINPLPSVSR